MTLFGTRKAAAAWADELLAPDAASAPYRTLLVHDAGNLTLVLE